MTLRAIRLRTSVTQDVFTRETCINSLYTNFQFSATTAFATCTMKNLNSYLYMLINGKHTHCLHVPFLFHWQIYGQQPSSTSSPRDKRKKAEWTSKKQTSVDDVKNKTSILNRITIVFHHCVSLIWTFQ